jgi:heme/copper-type cytochrome/quinol oxidase subunit 2
MDQSQPFSQTPNPRPKNWLVESILVTIFCCLPFGIAGIVFASSINSKYDAGDYAGALSASQQAGKWTKIGFWVGLSIIILYFIFIFTVGISLIPKH